VAGEFLIETMQNNRFDTKEIHDLETDYIDDFEYNEAASLTTALAIKCNNGIVFASDSQSTSDFRKSKNLDTSKIFKINNYTGLTGSGDSLHINIVAEELKKVLPYETINSDELLKKLEAALLDLHKKHNTIRSELLGYSETKSLFHPICIVGAKCSNGYFLYCLRDDAWVEPIYDYKVIGSGRELARLLIDQQIRIPKSIGKSVKDLELGYCSYISLLTINEIKKFDNQTGGYINFTYISDKGLIEVKPEDVEKGYKDFTNNLSKQLSKTFQDDSVEMFKAFFKINQ
jgi:20S proteasome alpha/beta subunit